MTQSPELTRSLELVARAAEVCRDPWWIIGSAAMALVGLEDVTVADVDVLTSRKDAGRMGGRLGAIPIHKPIDRFRSSFLGTGDTTPLPIEIMGALEVRVEETWLRLTPQTRKKVYLGKTVLFVPSAAEQIAILKMFGREKDLERAAALERRHADAPEAEVPEARNPEAETEAPAAEPEA